MHTCVFPGVGSCMLGNLSIRLQMYMCPCTYAPGHGYPHMHHMCVCVYMCGPMHRHWCESMRASVVVSARTFVYLGMCTHLGVHVHLHTCV